jgi:hypothetical protein
MTAKQLDRGALIFFVLFILCLCPVVCGTGCATSMLLGKGAVQTRLHETITDDAGVTDVIDFRVSSRADKYGKTAESAHTLKYTWGGKTNTIAIGQNAGAIDNTAQAEMAKAVAAAWAPFLDEAGKSLSKLYEAAGAIAKVFAPSPVSLNIAPSLIGK